MSTHKFLVFTLSVSLTFLGISCNKHSAKNTSNADEMQIRAIHEAYVSSWLNADEQGVLELFEDNARIQPNTLKPIEGKSNIQKFWFPNDSSETTINDYRTKIISLDVMDTLALTTHESILDWTYEKDSIRFGMFQKGFSTTIYRKQADESWKIWRSMWTDVYVERK